MRRMPIYFLIDVSISMRGKPIKQVSNGVKAIIERMKADPYLWEAIFISFITFSDTIQEIRGLTALDECIEPIYSIIPREASIPNVLSSLSCELDRSIKTTTAEVKGDLEPIVLLFTNNDIDFNLEEINRWNNKNQIGRAHV